MRLFDFSLYLSDMFDLDVMSDKQVMTVVLRIEVDVTSTLYCKQYAHITMSRKVVHE